MNKTQNDFNQEDGPASLDRRQLLGAGAALAAASLLPRIPAQAQNQGATSAGTTPQTAPLGRRRLGALEVSAVGMGVQNMHRKYTTEVPYRPEMIRILRAAYERGVTFFDCAEAYGPFENERILGEAIEPFRDKVRITSKFGWNIDLETGERRPGLNSRPEHIKLAVEGMLKRLKTDSLFQHEMRLKTATKD